jgi:ABC-2 type transport system ATP-binding protein
MDEAERCTRVGFMYAGKLIADDTPAEIKKIVMGDVLELIPSDFAVAKGLVISMEGVQEVQTYGDKLHVFVDDADRRAVEIATALASHGIGHAEIRRIEVHMEEAFISLIRQHMQPKPEHFVATQQEIQ